MKLRVGWNANAVYEFRQHSVIGLRCGLTGDEIAALTKAPNTHDWRADDLALITMADELAADAWRGAAGQVGLSPGRRVPSNRAPGCQPATGPHGDARARDRRGARMHRLLPVPRNPSGKTLRTALRTPHRDGREQQVTEARADTGIAPAASALARPAPPGVAGGAV